MEWQLLLLVASAWLVASQESPLVEVPGLGAIRGATSLSVRRNRTVYEFRGIPFAKAPTGERRYQPPESVEPWEGELDATKQGAPCPQLTVNFTLYENSRDDVEDCLSVNVFTPTLNTASNLPVMVFIHGGGFVSGSSASYNPGYFLDYDVLLVVPQYRLGVLGFLSIQTDDFPGNAAMLDVVLALEWVQSYIEYFGGDKGKVTLFGESAGSTITSFMMVSPLAEGLFHQVIGESGSFVGTGYLAEGREEDAIEIANEAGCEGGEIDNVTMCLKTIPAENLVNAYSIYSKRRSVECKVGIEGRHPVIQKAGKVKFLESDPIELLKSGNYNRVPAIFGTNKQEGTYFFTVIYEPYIVANNLTTNEMFLKDELTEKLLQFIDVPDPGHVVVDAVNEKYFKNVNPSNFSSYVPAIVDLLGVGSMKGPTYRMMQENSRFETSYYYSFNYYNPAIPSFYPTYPFPIGVDHATEILYLFPALPLQEEADDVSRRLVNLWTNFAIYGNPTPTNAPIEGVSEWKPYETNDEWYLRIENEFSLQQNFKEEFTVTADEGFPGTH